MAHQFASIMFTDGVKAAQEHIGSRAQYERFSASAGPNNALSEKEVSFIAQRDTFYMATVNADGWPYVQHRGGPVGFLRALGSGCLAYADFRGNKQMISVGNARTNDRVSIILVDYPNRRRLKILGHLRVEDADAVTPEELAQVDLPDYKAHIERVMFIDVAAFDWNCPQHITRRYTEAEFLALAQSQ
jgi:predicted pyridoxine 5'-phosphate oxidase superfamily flavin-nucleotide-binding protein